MKYVPAFFLVSALCAAVLAAVPPARAQGTDFSPVPHAFGANAVPKYDAVDDEQDSGVQVNTGSRLIRYKDPFASFYGHLPVHPGDYRDAIDRGQFNGHTFSRNPPQNVVR